MDQEETLLTFLNAEQREAVQSTEGYVRVIAGAGSGKTRTLAHRFAYLISHLGIMSDKILCVTFTNKATAEMRRRISHLLQENSTAWQIYTFHSFCCHLLREDITHLHYPPNFTILDETDQKSLVKEVFTDLEIGSRELSYRRVMDKIEEFKNDLRYVELLLDPDLQELKSLLVQEDDLLNRVIYQYMLKQRRAFALDYQDLIHFTLYLFAEFPEILNKWQTCLEYIEVDEFQDVSDKEYTLVTQLAAKHHNLFVVGDPDQTIYSWRGANVNIILQFHQDFTTAKTIYLNHNYRSSPEILQVANSLIRHNQNRLEKELIPHKQSHRLPSYFHAKTSQEEATWIAQQIKALLATGVRTDEIAILFRSHFVSRNLEEALIKERLPYVLHNGVDFYSRAEIKDCLAYLRLLVSDDDLAFLRVVNNPCRNIGKKRINLLKNLSEQQQSSLYQTLKNNLQETLLQQSKATEFVQIIEDARQKLATEPTRISVLLDELLKNSGYERLYMTSGDADKLDNLAEFKNSLVLYEETLGEQSNLADYLTEIALYTDRDRKKSEGCLKLMTIHTAKGLEFKYVFLCALNEGIFPSRRTLTAEQMEEERRLAYVAFTRAMDGLYLSDAEGMNFDGSYRFPSRFLFNIDKQLVSYENATDLNAELFTEAKNFAHRHEKHLHGEPMLEQRERVQHAELGVGTILEVDAKTHRYLIQFDDLPTPRSIRADFVQLLTGKS